jgi:hypothetical protein
MISDARYNRGKVYKIVSPSTDLVYIGSTIQPLHKRLREHRNKYTQFLKGKYCNVTSFEIMKYGDAEIYLIELCDCNSKMELERCERSHIESIECVNKLIPGRTQKEYYNDNRDKFKQYYIDNKEKNKQYYIDNPEIKKQYYIDNKDKNKITCNICDKSINKYNLKKHQKTQSCKSYICIFLDE